MSIIFAMVVLGCVVIATIVQTLRRSQRRRWRAERRTRHAVLAHAWATSHPADGPRGERLAFEGVDAGFAENNSADSSPASAPIA